MRILYAGTPLIAVPSLEILAKNFDVCGVLTNPDKVKGRGKRIFAPPVKEKADELGLPVLQFDFLRSEAREAVKELAPDILVVFAYGKIFGPLFLSLFGQGAVNIHPSLLPKYRGSSPILSAILEGENETGISVQKISLEMDKGDILRQISFKLTENETTASLSQKVGEMSAPLIADTLRDLKAGLIKAIPQDEMEATYCAKVRKEDGLINWEESAAVIERKIRAFTPWPGCFTFFNGKKLNIVSASIYKLQPNNAKPPGSVMGVDKKEGILIQTGEDVLAVTSLQLQSKKILDWKTFLNGTPGILDSLLGGSG